MPVADLMGRIAVEVERPRAVDILEVNAVSGDDRGQAGGRRRLFQERLRVSREQIVVSSASSAGPFPAQV